MHRRPSLAPHLWFIATGSLFIVVTRPGHLTLFADYWLASCVLAAIAAVLVNAGDRRAKKMRNASLRALTSC